MTQTQKSWIELPLMLLLLWILQAFELSLLHLPYYLGTPQVISILVAYIAFTRGWMSTTILTLILSFIASANVGFPTGVFIAAHIWTALITKTIVASLTLEGRPAFVALVVGFSLILRSITWTLLEFSGASLTLPLFLAQIFVQTFVFAALGWILYSVFCYWDHFFDHMQDDDHNRGVRTHILR